MWKSRLLGKPCPPPTSLELAPILESIPALTLAISDANQFNFHHLAHSIDQTQGKQS
jgi:hypothetical protein